MDTYIHTQNKKVREGEKKRGMEGGSTEDREREEGVIGREGASKIACNDPTS